MIHTLNCKGYSADISDVGAELTSLKDTQGKEYIWEADPKIWGSSAPVLFPIVGSLKEDLYRYDGKSYPLKRHGFARHSNFEIVTDTPEEKCFILRSSAETEEVYPFKFDFEVNFKLSPGNLVITYKVKNRDDIPMPFGLGSHPAFALDLEDSVIEDYYIEFSQPESLDLFLLENSLIKDEPEGLFLNNETTIPLSETIFDQDALIFKNISSQEISLVHKTKGCIISLDRGNCSHLGIWAKPKAPYVCIEPWHSYADIASHNQNITEKEAIQTLDPGAEFESYYKIELH